jgi:hypothetical protein
MIRAAALFAALAVGCAPPDDPPVSPIADVGDESPAWGRAPFPSDVHLNGGRFEPPADLERVFPNRTARVAAHLATLDGFGVRPAIEIPVDGPINPASLEGRAHVYADDGTEVAYRWRFDAERQVISGAPELGVVLRGGATYVAALEHGVVDDRGRPLERPASLDALRDDPPPIWRSTAEVLARPEAEGWISLAVFTTQRVQRTARTGRALLDSGAITEPVISFPDPALIVTGDDLDRLLGVAARFDSGPRAGQERWGSSNPTGIAHEHVGAIATGRLATSRFRRPDTGTDDPADETFELDPETGAPLPASIDSIPVTIIVPAAPPPPGGYPVAIIAHGLGASRHAMLTFAEPLTAAGFALVAIDADGHGSRWRDVDVRNNLASRLAEFSGDPEMVDGFGDSDGLLSTFDFLENLDNFSGARDAVLQSVLDTCQLIAALRRDDLDLSALGDVRIDPGSIAFLGESFGTIVGGIVAAIEPHVDLYVLDVPAAGLIDLSIINSPALATILTPLAIARYGLHGSIDRFNPGVALLQALIDPADPLSYAPDVLGPRSPGPRHVIAIEVIGDEVLHNLASESLAAALGLDLLSPHARVPAGVAPIDSPASGNRDGQTAVLVQYAPATHGANWSSEVGTLRYQPGFPHPGDDPFPQLPEPIEIANPIYPTLEQVVGILETHRAGGIPVVESTLAPVL